MSNPTFLFTNNLSTTLASSITSSATSLTLASAANLPSSIPSGQTLCITLNDAATQQIFEIIYATGPISGATINGCTRGEEGTTAQNWNAGDFVFAGLTKGIMNNYQQNGPFTLASLVNPGYVTYPNGLIDQWGIITTIGGEGGTVTQSYPVAFTSSVFAVTFGINNNFGTTPYAYGPPQYTTTTSALTVWLQGGPSSSATTLTWRAIGI